jgi:hypothetical protein
MKTYFEIVRQLNHIAQSRRKQWGNNKCATVREAGDRLMLEGYMQALDDLAQVMDVTPEGCLDRGRRWDEALRTILT